MLLAKRQPLGKAGARQVEDRGLTSNGVRMGRRTLAMPPRTAGGAPAAHPARGRADTSGSSWQPGVLFYAFWSQNTDQNGTGVPQS